MDKRREEIHGNLSCSFCGKSQKEVKKLIAGPTVYICDECIGLCNDIIAEEIEKEDRDGKSRLLEWGQKRRKKVEFIVREEGGGGRGKHYVAEVHIGGEVRGTGRGVSKKVAEQDAAQSAFRGMRSRKPARLGLPGLVSAIASR